MVFGNEKLYMSEAHGIIVAVVVSNRDLQSLLPTKTPSINEGVFCFTTMIYTVYILFSEK
jgi:hypothetical protein